MGYEAAAATARAMLARKGTAVSVLRKGQGAIDPITQRRAPTGDLTARFNCIALPPGRSAEVQIGTLVGRKLTMFYMARTFGTFDPQPGDTVPFGGKTWTLIWTATYDPDGSGSVLTIAYGEVS